MAKVKKKEALSLEEKLEQALVPVDEQPYDVPENWCWVYSLKLFDIEYGRGLPTKNLTEEGYPVFGANGQIGYYSEYMYEDEKALMSCRGAYSGTMNQSLPKSYVTSNSLVIEDKGKFMLPKYICFMYEALDTSKLVSGSAQPQVTVQAFEKYPIPLPPLAEQQRIVEQIENLFAKLDEAKDKAQNVIDCYENTVSAILHKAFTGELSNKWRESNGKTKDAWCSKKINEVCVPRAGYAFDSKKFQSTGCQIIRMGNLYGGVLDLSRSPVFIDEAELDDGIIKRSKIHDGDILITLTGTKYKRDYGYAVCIDNPVDLYVNQRILCLSPNPEIDTNFLLYYLRSNIFRDVFFSNETGGVNQGNVSSKFVENIELQIPSLEEQKVIAMMLKDILTKEEQAKELTETVVQQIDLMKKSILAKAFRGELATNNPDEESAVELLKQIIAEDL